MTLAEYTPGNRSKFYLLCDFWDAYNTFELKQITSIPEIDGEIRPKMIASLESSVDCLELLDLRHLRQVGKELLPIGSFIVTLDGGIIFSSHDFSIEITRACTNLKNVCAGPYVRMPRGYSAHMSQQFIDLRNKFRSSGKDKIVICDDGLGTGGTMKRIISGLKELDLNVDLIVTITNPNCQNSINEIPISSLVNTSDPYNWLNERDLYWGLPRSGVSISSKLNFLGIGGVPYTISTEMVESRIGLNANRSEKFRQASLDCNSIMWKLLERFHGRKLTIRDSSRLSFMAEILGSNRDVVSILSEARDTNFFDTLLSS